MLTVATGAYVPLQARLLASLDAAGWAGGRLSWTGVLPPGSPSHAEVPYGFKLYAFREAVRRGVESAFWLDSPCVAVAPLEAAFDRIDRDGHLLVTGGERLGNWASDDCLSAFGLSRDAAMSLPLINGTYMGLDLRSERSRRWLDGMVEHAGRGLFSGPYLTDHAPEEVRTRKLGKSLGRLGDDARVWGHRHDEAIGSCLAHVLGLSVAEASTLREIEYRG